MTEVDPATPGGGWAPGAPGGPGAPDGPGDPGAPPPMPPPPTPPGGWPGMRRRTEPFAVVALVCAIAAVWTCFVGSILGIVFGHIARARIERSGDQGGGMALAGVIVGYVGLGVGVLAVAAVIALAVASSGGDARHEARALAQRIDAVALARGTSPRDALVVHRAVRGGGCEFDSCAWVTVGATGRRAGGAYPEELEAAGWRLQVADGDDRACLTVPPATGDAPVIVARRC